MASRLCCFLSFLLIAIVVLGAAKEARAVTVVALGDSTTAGTPQFRSPVEVPPHGAGNEESQYVYWLAKRFPDWKILNRGVNGERSDQIRNRLAADMTAFQPDVLIVLAGVNDLYQGYPPQWVTGQLTLIYEQALAAKVHVVACTILPFNVSTPQVRQHMDAVNAWIRQYAAEKGLALVDTYALLEDPQNPGRLRHSQDQLHPDVEGYRRMGEAMADNLDGWRGSLSSGR